VVGEGWHRGPGTPHAEVNALAAAGDRAPGATLYCTLEPCDHVGRTPPCTSALVESGIARAVVATGDPNPVSTGGGSHVSGLKASRLRSETLGSEARRLNAAFERHVLTGLPFVTLKTAASLDGKTAARDRSSQWITGEDARNDAHVLRGAADAIVVGAGTVIADDPSLTVRDPSYGGRPPLRVVVDASGRVPPAARVFDEAAPTLIAATDRVDPGLADAWAAGVAEVVAFDRDETGGVSLPALMAHLGKRDVQGVLVEGGATLAWSFVRDQLIDRGGGVSGAEAGRRLGSAGDPHGRRVRTDRRGGPRCGSFASIGSATTYGWRPMFTGIVEERGTVREVGAFRLVVACRTVVFDSDIGASVAVNGVCLTVVARGPEDLAFDLSEETLARSTLGRLAARRPGQPRAARDALRAAGRPHGAGARGRRR
jgi:diaminohydroxyphosphoribosylaminopyrimidine deaminase/5-amino-6-(5-phosphoribosylamino)uracil reductase